MMDVGTIALLIGGGGALGVVVWVLAKIGRILIKIAEALAAAAVVFLALWLMIKAVGWALRQTLTHWRTSLTLVALGAWWHWWGPVSLVITVAVVASMLLGWRLADLASFDAWAGRHLRAWWLRWTIYAPKLPHWLQACGLGIKHDAVPVVFAVTPLARALGRSRRAVAPTELPKVVGVRSGASWDLVRVQLVPGQKPEDFDEATRALACARGVTRCQVRELTPNVVSIDFQRRNLLTDPVPCLDLTALTDVPGAAVDLRRVWSGRTEYGQDWHVPLAGGHTLVAGATGAGKNSVMWCPLVTISPAIRDGLVRVSGIDPKGMELAYGRRIVARYAVTGTEALAVLDELIATMEARKAQFAGQVRAVPISAEHPLELVEFDEIGALTKYTDRKTREAITERVALLTTQGRALGFTVRGYVQEPTKDTVPVRELFPRRICLRVSAKAHVGMVLGDQAYERGAWAHRITEAEAGVGYVFGEGIREPLRIRAGWVPDDTIKHLETFVTGPVSHNTAVLPFPTKPTGPRWVDTWGCCMSTPITAPAEVPSGQSRIERMRQPLTADVLVAVADAHGVCVRPFTMEVGDPDTGELRYVPLPCGSTAESVCGPCARKARALRMAQCREGWHLAEEPSLEADEPTAEQQAQLTVRADLVSQYRDAVSVGRVCEVDDLREAIREADDKLRQLGVRGRLPSPDLPGRRPGKRSTRRRQDAPNLPTRRISRTTVGREYAGKFRPSMFVTLICDSYGRVRPDGTPVDPGSYDYRRAARDAVHFSSLVDRWWQNLRRVVGWDVQYFATVEPQRRAAPHLHTALRGSIPHEVIRQVTAATYHQVWWPQHDHLVYTASRLPVWEPTVNGFVDPDTRQPLTLWAEALEAVSEPAHVVTFRSQVHSKGILGDTDEAGRHLGYLTKYLVKSVTEIVRRIPKRSSATPTACTLSCR